MGFFSKDVSSVAMTHLSDSTRGGSIPGIATSTKGTLAGIRKDRISSSTGVVCHRNKWASFDVSSVAMTHLSDSTKDDSIPGIATSTKENASLGRDPQDRISSGTGVVCHRNKWDWSQVSQ